MFKKLLVLFSVLVFTACSAFKSAENFEEGKIAVATTVGMLGDVIKNVGGEFVDVQALMGPGVDPHLYKPSAGDIDLMEQADVVFYVGLHLEGKMTETFDSLKKKKKVVAVGETIDENKLLAPQVGQTGSHDPHIWFDVELWSDTVNEVRDTLIEVDPKNSETYTANASNYLKELKDLDLWVKEQMALIPEDQRLLVTAHDAFNYFGAAYGMEVKGLQGISTASDYGLKDLENLIDVIVERKIKAVFVESSVPRKSIEALQQGVAAKDWEVEIGGQLFSDAMGDANSAEGTYIGMVKYNVNTIVNALK